MIEAPVGYRCPICAGRMTDAAGGAAAYRARTAVERRTARSPIGRLLRTGSVTNAIIGVCAAVLLLMYLTRRPTDVDVLVRFGALYPHASWWRLVTAIFVHIGPLHLLFNAWALLIFGGSLEQRYGKFRYLLLFLASGVLGSAFSLAFTQGGIRAGASGGVFGVLGAWLAYFVRHRSSPGLQGQLRSLLFLIGINLFFGVALRGGVDNFAHIGGLIGGIAIGSAAEWTSRVPGRTRTVIWYAAIAATLVLAGFLAAPNLG